MTNVPQVDEPNFFEEPGMANTLRVTLVAMLVSALAISALTLFLRWRHTPQLALMSAASCLVALVLSRSGRIRSAMLLPLLSITYAILHLAARSDGIQNIGLAILPVLILLGSLVLDLLTLVFFTAAEILAIAAMLAIRYFVLQAERFSTNDMGDLFIFALTAATAALLGRLLAVRIEDGFRLVRDSESRYRRIFENVQDVYYEMNIDGILLELNPASAALFGIPREAMIGRPLTPFCEKRSEYDALLEAVRARGRVSNHEFVIRDSGAAIRHVLVNASLKTGPRTGEERVIGSIRDITERKRAEGALRESERTFREFLEGVQFVALVTNLNGKIIFCNDYTLVITGWSKEEVIGRGAKELLDPESRLQFADQTAIAPPAVRAQRFLEGSILQKNGGRRWIQWSSTPLRDFAGRVTGFASLGEDVTELRTLRAEAARREGEERFRDMADTAPVMIWVSGPDKLCTFFNKPWLDFTGSTMDQAVGNGWIEKVHPEDRDRCYTNYFSAFEAHRTFQAECRVRRRDGEYRWMLATGAPRFESSGAFVGYVGSCTDITDVRRAQEEALARQKLESLGVLAGGIAHDFNNLLGSIIANSELVLSELPGGSPASEGVESIRSVACRAAAIVGQMMAYAGQEDTVFEPVDLAGLFQEMLEFLKVSISKRATLNVTLPVKLPSVRANAAQLRQVVLNLISNSSEALGEQEGVISVAVTQVQSGPSDSVPNLSRGDYVRLEVSDTGCGMTEQIQSRIFDPFFTTKFPGRGMGLAAVKGIIRSHGGAINVVSSSGQGSRFEVLLPCSSELAREGHDEAVSSAAGEVGSVAGTVLFVEDEDTLRLAVSKMLRRKGFAVIEAANGKTGVDLFRASAPEIDVVLLDLTLPGMSGGEALSELRRIKPNVTVIITSAYSQEQAQTTLGGQQPWLYIRKPYHFNELAGLLGKSIGTNDE
jgi:PAS domain S-box-containing protein